MRGGRRRARRTGRLAVGFALTVAVSACAAHRRPDGRATRSPAARPRPAAAAGESGSLESFITKVRELSARARPLTTTAPTIETVDARLAAALAVSRSDPSPESLRAVAAEYRRVGVLDRAHGALERALALRPTDPVTHDALARLWRDEGFPHLALGHAHRAVHFSRGAAASRNTLGTVLHALGRHDEASAEFAAIVAAKPDAAYAWNNLCYGAIAQGRPAEATDACRRALRLSPGFTPAQNNLGLARAQAGDYDGAAAAFGLAGSAPRADFNMGLAWAAAGQYAEAASAFARAHQAVPQWQDAAWLAQEAARASRVATDQSGPE